ncbi:MAG: BamA/TamA family outer membrane protein [Campylobacterales bacterium]|nr:BamA/TamA family outer membrane protein [Campylobacterales bacterium]
MIARVAPLILCALQLWGAESLPFVFEGNTHISSATLYEALGESEPSFYQFWRPRPHLQLSAAETYARGLQQYLKSVGFYHASVRYTYDEELLQFIIDEGAPVSVADVTVLSTLGVDDLVVLRVGKRFVSQTFVADKSAILGRAKDMGYCNAELRSKAWIDIETDQAYILHELDPKALCSFGAVTVQTDERIDEWVARSFLRFKPNERYSQEKIRQSYEMLYAQEGIAKALIEELEHNATRVPIRLHVSSREEPIRFRAGIGANSDEGVVLQAGITHRNLWQNLKTLGLQGRSSMIKEEIKSTFTMPLPYHNLWGTTLGYKNEHFEGYSEENLYLTPYLQQYDQPHTFKEGLLFERVNTYDSKDELRFPTKEIVISSALFHWKYDERDKILEPTKGFYLFANVQGALASFLSDATYSKFQVGGGRLFSYDRQVLGLKVHYGDIKLHYGELPASYRFYAGGMNSNRAYGYRQLGPKSDQGDPLGFGTLLEATAEYRFPLYGALRGVLFNDTTMAGRIDLPYENHPYVTFGTGLRYATPIGPVAIDAGIDVNDPSHYAFHFHIGELF